MSSKTIDMKELVAKGVVGTVTPLAGFVVSTMPQIKEWLQLIALIGGVAVSIVTFISICRQISRGKIERAKIEAELCEDCRRGAEPARCPIPKSERPSNCTKIGHA